MKKKGKKVSKDYEEDITNLASKEEEIINSYTDDDIDEDMEYEIDEEDLYSVDALTEKNNNIKTYYEEPVIYEETTYEDFDTKIDADFEDDDDDMDDDDDDEYNVEQKSPKSKKGLSLFFNIIFVIIMVVIIMITVDTIVVARYNAGPYFALPIHTYEDGGTVEYYGVGYKVIEYNQVQGRRDKEIGLWSLQYTTDPITLQDIDLSIEMTGNEKKIYEKYYKKFVRIISTLKSVDEKNHKITIGYADEDGKYSLDFICTVVKDQTNLSELEEGKEITIIGTVEDFKLKTNKKPNRLYITNCFAEQ